MTSSAKRESLWERPARQIFARDLPIQRRVWSAPSLGTWSTSLTNHERLQPTRSGRYTILKHFMLEIGDEL